MRTIKIAFVDFWAGFQQDNNYFYHLLSTKYNVKIDTEDPDFIFFSVDFARKRERDRYTCPKIFFTGESVSPNFDSFDSIEMQNHAATYSIGKCDFAFSFDFNDDPRHYRLPLWVMYIDWFGKSGYGNPKYLLPFDELDDNVFLNQKKKKFCATIFSNPEALRMDAMHKLSTYRIVHGYGARFGNGSGFDGEYKKYEILKDYKFSLCFENRSREGYYTEKLFHAKTAGNVPIYWGDKRVCEDFNDKGFINYANFDSLDDLVQYVKYVDQTPAIYQRYVEEPLFPDNKINQDFLPENVLKFIEDKIL